MVLVATAVHGGELDEFYLSKFRMGAANARATGVGAEAGNLVIEPCRTWLYHDLRRDWNKLEPQTQKTLAKVLPARPTWPDEQTVLSTGGHFRIHYTSTQPDAPPSLAWVNTVAQTMDDVRTYVANNLGYRPAPTLNGAPYDVFLKNVGTTSNEFGETVSDAEVTSTSSTSYMVIDNDFSTTEFGNQIADYTPQKALQITAAHEYHHAVQFGYNFYFEGWYAEATSTWIEDEVYDNVNQLYSYLPGYMQNTDRSIDIRPDVSLGGGYGRWIFNRHLAERFDLPVVREVWERLGTMPRPADVNTNIPMLPVIGAVLSGRGSSLDSEFFLFTKKLYTRNWTSHLPEINLIHPVVPLNTYNSYPVNTSSSAVPTVTLPHYAFGYVLFQPSPSAPATLAIDVQQAAGIRSTGFRKSTGDVIAEFPPDGAGVIVIPSFTSGTVEAALLVSNSSDKDQQTANFSTDNSTPSPATAPAASGGGGGGGCFIATAAYGSYLHPKVRVLRDFRDEYLMTSAIGRIFVKGYYRLSPPLAAVISRHESLRMLSRFFLTPLIAAVEHPRLATVTLCGGVAGGSALLVCYAVRLRREKHQSV